MSKRGPYTEEEVHHVREMFANKEPLAQIAHAMNRKPVSVWQQLKKMGLVEPKPREPKKPPKVKVADGQFVRKTKKHDASSYQAEADAIASIAEILKILSDNARIRVLRYQYELFGISWIEGIVPESLKQEPTT